MGQSVDKVYGAEPRRGTLFFFNPFKMTIVGYDDDNTESILADADRTKGYDEAKVQTIMYVGVITPVSFRKNGLKKNKQPNTEVVVGRDRVLSTREAWVRMKKAGAKEKDLPLVPAILSRGEEKDMLAIQMIENMVRKDETPLSAARKAFKHYQLTKDKKQTALLSGGKSVQTIDIWFKMLELSPDVHALIERGDVAGHAAVALLKDVKLEEQGARMKQLIAEGKVTGLAAKSEVLRTRMQSGGDGGEVVSLPPKRAVRAFRETLDEVAAPDGGFTLTHVRGLLDFLLDGKPLRGPFRAAWASMLKAKEEAKAEAASAKKKRPKADAAPTAATDEDERASRIHDEEAADVEDEASDIEDEDEEEVIEDEEDDEEE